MDEKKRIIRTAFIEALPLAIAIGAYGLSYGVLGVQADFSLISIVGMSLFVFSGSLQMVAVGMIMAGGSYASILITSVLLNLRNLLYGAALAEGIAPAGKWKWLLAYGVTDEPFVLGSARFKKYGPDPLYFGVVVGTFYFAWFLASLLGGLIGNQVDPQKWGLDLAFPITFAAILISSLTEKPAVATAMFAAILAIGLEYLIPGNEFTIIITGAISPFVGIYLKGRSSKC